MTAVRGGPAVTRGRWRAWAGETYPGGFWSARSVRPGSGAAPVSRNGLDQRQSGHCRRVGAQDTGAQRNCRNEWKTAQFRALIFGKTALRSDQQRERRRGQRDEERHGIGFRAAFVAEDDPAARFFAAPAREDRAEIGGGI